MSAQPSQPLAGKRIAVVVENKFIPEEIAAYRYGFGTLGAEVEFVSRLHYGEHRPEKTKFSADVDPNDQPAWVIPELLEVETDISGLNLDRYSALLMAANYTSVRLRYNELPDADRLPADFDLLAHLQGAPVVRKFAEAMERPNLIKGFLCHGLWILTPVGHLLRGRTVVCHEVVAADIVPHGARIDFTRRVIVDRDLVTGYSKNEVIPYVQAIAELLR